MAKANALVTDDLKPSKGPTANPGGTRQHGAVPSDDLIPMQFRMKPDFAQKFRMEATKRGMKYNELLKEAMALYYKMNP